MPHKRYYAQRKMIESPIVFLFIQLLLNSHTVNLDDPFIFLKKDLPVTFNFMFM